MIEDLINADLVAHVLSSEDSNETEIELATRLQVAIDEIEALTAQVQLLLTKVPESPNGNEA